MMGIIRTTTEQSVELAAWLDAATSPSPCALSAERVRRLLALLDEGLAFEVVAERIGCHYNTVSKYARLNGRGRYNRSPTPAMEEQMRKLAAQGLSYWRIARRLGVHHETVSRVLRTRRREAGARRTS